MAAHPRGMPRRRWLALLLAGAGTSTSMAAEADPKECEALESQMAHLNPGLWAPSFVFRSQEVRPGAIHPPNKTRQTGDVKLPGICESDLFRADVFEWQKPTSDGGDWIANTASAPMHINIDGVACPLTGIALTTAGWPSLRLQFEQCPRKTAVEVPLVNASGSGMRLVRWMCKVSGPSKLCSQANLLLPVDQRQESWSDQKLLDLTSFAAVASKGVSRMQVYSNCYENLDWFVVNTPLGLDTGEWAMIHAIMKVLAPSSHSTVRIPSNIVVETTCIPDCSGHVSPECLAPAAATPAPLAAAKANGPEKSFENFAEDFQDKAVAPWLAYFFGGIFVLFSLLFYCCASCFCRPDRKSAERKIKKVSVVYHEVPEESQTFFTGMNR
mmetsp:Transcript_42232/g.111662  ORF Transcript_42232/g.111662 Transcript_42232/m.111662 type:complete len:384 (+) Transcript_42232:69-1220(+)